MQKEYTPTIGLEIHVELKTKTKMFCSSANMPHESKPNTHICPVCMGHPGTLPVVNEEAVKHVLKVGVALGGKIASFTEFDRKNYFYPDIPKGYQISQYAYPLISGGELCGVQVTRVHLEEDTARSLHEGRAGSAIDYNRAGVPLMELVTEPVIHDAVTAGKFARELQLLLRTVGVSDANMEKGEMRIEANISVSKNETFGTKVEVKNLNSFRSVESAIACEIERQAELLERGEKVVQETRGWDETRMKTFSQRIKESSDDYRYFGDPDIPKFNLSLVPEYSLSSLSENMPTLPNVIRSKYEDLGVTKEQIETLGFDTKVSYFFESLLRLESDIAIIKLSANYLLSDVMALITEDRSLDLDRTQPFVSLMKMLAEGKITSRVAKDMLPSVLFESIDPVQYANEHNLLQNNSEEALLSIVREILNSNETVASDYRAGKSNALQYLVGLGMKATRGSANPSILAETFKREIGS